MNKDLLAENGEEFSLPLFWLDIILMKTEKQKFFRKKNLFMKKI